jgi:hypothetical protein
MGLLSILSDGDGRSCFGKGMIIDVNNVPIMTGGSWHGNVGSGWTESNYEILAPESCKSTAKSWFLGLILTTLKALER